MKITVEHYGMKIEASVPQDDLNIFQVAELVATVLIGAGFVQESIEKIMPNIECVGWEDEPVYGVSR